MITSDLKHNSKAFYSYLRTRRKVKSIVTVLKKADGSMTENDTETADCFANAFSSVSVNEPIGPLPHHCYKLSDETISEVGISEGDVHQQGTSQPPPPLEKFMPPLAKPRGGIGPPLGTVVREGGSGYNRPLLGHSVVSGDVSWSIFNQKDV